MRTLKRLEIGQMNGFEKLSAEEQGMIFGGYSKKEGNCFWNCMEYCSKKFDDKGDRHNYEYYGNGYGAGAGTWPGTGSICEGVDKGVIYSSRPYDYLASQFETEGSEWTTGSNMTKYFGSNYDKNSVIIGTFDTKGLDKIGSEGSEAHAVILTGYDPEKKRYSYKEAHGGKTKYVDEKWMIGAAKVTGKKAKTEGSDN